MLPGIFPEKQQKLRRGFMSVDIAKHARSEIKLCGFSFAVVGWWEEIRFFWWRQQEPPIKTGDERSLPT